MGAGRRCSLAVCSRIIIPVQWWGCKLEAGRSCHSLQLLRLYCSFCKQLFKVFWVPAHTPQPTITLLHKKIPHSTVLPRHISDLIRFVAQFKLHWSCWRFGCSFALCSGGTLEKSAIMCNKRASAVGVVTAGVKFIGDRWHVNSCDTLQTKMCDIGNRHSEQWNVCVCVCVCTILYCTVLYCTVLYSTVQYSTV